MSIGERISILRKKTNLSQDELSKLMNVKRVTLSKIENNERKLLAEELIQLSSIFNISIDELVNPDKMPKINLKKEVNVKKQVENSIRIDVPQQNVEKFKQVLLYILKKVGSKPNIGQTVIYKLLYFIDFNYYEKYEEQLIGATYIKNNFGPTPIEFKKITGQMIKDNEIEEVKSEHFNYPQTKYLPIVEPDLSVLNGNELEMINRVLKDLSDKNANEMSDYSHRDVPWIVSEKGKPIKYESVFYRTSEYSLIDDDGT